VSYDRIGDVLEAQGNLPEALKSFRDGLAIADRLARADPGNADWQRALAVSHAHLADVYRRSNDPDNALAALRQGQSVMKQVVKLSPDNAGWKNDLGWFNDQIAALTK
jgi:tetratricopeptide (TPR) repeat protein